MSRKYLIVGESTWEIDRDVEKVVGQVREALANRTVADVEVLDGAGRVVSVLVNGAAAPAVVIDLGAGPRPSEIYG
jgi:hypothetical protein